MEGIVLVEFKNFCVLYAEDDLEVQANISKILSLLFLKVHVASDGEEALELFKKNNIHIIITDYEMPRVDGYKFILKIREMSQTIPIVVLSSHTQKEKLMNCIPLKLIEYLEKPIIYEKLLQTLKKCVKEIKNSADVEVMIGEDIFYNIESNHIQKNAKTLKLTALEMRAFEYMFSKKNILVSNEELGFYVYDSHDYSVGAIKNIIYRLRKKLGREFIQNHKDIGYILKSL